MRTALERFNEKWVEDESITPSYVDTPCWRWTAHIDRHGYGRFGWGYKSLKASQASYRLHKGDLKPGDCVCHKCDNPSCVNPDHLFLGSQTDNLADMTLKGRRRFRSHPGKMNGRALLSEEQVMHIKRSGDVGTARRMGECFGITKGGAEAIFYGRTWRHLTADKAECNE